MFKGHPSNGTIAASLQVTVIDLGFLITFTVLHTILGDDLDPRPGKSGVGLYADDIIRMFARLFLSGPLMWFI
jgi:hypothetical protein